MIPLAALRFCTILLGALSLTMESAHVLELPQKLTYDATMYAAVNTTLYRYFAVVGGAYQVLALLLAIVLVLLLRHRGLSIGWTLVGAVFLLSAFATWLAVVEPVNVEVADQLRRAPDAAAAAIWLPLRNRWEAGHAAGFVLQLLGFSALIMSVLTAHPRTSPRPADDVS